MSWIGGNGELGEVAVRERVRERENRVRELKKEWEVKQKKGVESDISIKLLVMTCILSLLATLSDELGFIANNDTDVYDFLFSDNLFLSQSATKWVLSQKT